MSFAREGIVFIVAAIVITGIVCFFAYTRESAVLWVAGIVFALLTVWVAYFFRDPERTGDRGPDLVISAADGLIDSIVEVDEPAFLHGRAIRVSVFMSVFNVHVNRYPVSGVVRYVHYNKGKFISATSDKSSLVNEQMSIGLQTAQHRVLVRQIAGLIARRIVNYSREGDAVDQGDRMGLIRFGSRVDVFLPTGSAVRVKVGDRTAAGTTVLAELPR